MRASHPIHLLLGLTLWCAWFVAIYAGLSLGCASWAGAMDGDGLVRLNRWLVVLTVGVALLMLVLAGYCWKQALRTHGQPRFMARCAAALYLLSAAATVSVGAPLLWLLPCV